MIYFIQAEMGGPVKIGYADDPARRLGDLQIGSPIRLRLLCVVPGDRDEEQRLQTVFREDRLHGEWFAPTPRLAHRCGCLLGNPARDVDLLARDLADRLMPALVQAILPAIRSELMERFPEIDTTPELHDRLVGIKTLCDALGVSRSYVYDHADTLGAVRLGNGERSRLRFNLRTALAAYAPADAAPEPAPPMRAPRCRTRQPPSLELLPIKGRAPRIGE